MVMPVAVRMVMIMRVIMVMMRLVRSAIGAALGIEWRLDVRNRCTETDEHVMDDMITPDPDCRIGNFRRQMPVSDLPGERQQVPGICSAHFHKRLGLGANFNDAAIIKNQAISMAQQAGLRQIEQKCNRCAVGEPVGNHPHPAAMPRGFIQGNGCGGTLKNPYN